ncbi:MAG: putative metal-binding motif-containing protein [Sandaracinaceae bacterium]
MSASCVPEVCGPNPDRDGDGHQSTACGGNDCDDDDDRRYGGNTEICDGSHDEDCDDTTVAGDDGDADGDGYTSGTCCNGAVCGDDCDDGDRSVFPGARELCNGGDDDCNGTVDDEGATPLCPGGTCTAGRCDLTGWDRSFGGPSSDGAAAVAMDELGNVYVAATLEGDADFGSGADGGRGSTDAVLVAYGPDGVYQWHRRYGGTGADRAYDVSVDRSTGDVYFTCGIAGDADLGGGTRRGPAGFLVALSSSGTYRWDQPLPSGAILSVRAHARGIITAGWQTSAFDFGGGNRGLGGAGTVGFVAGYDELGAYQWDRPISGGIGSSAFARVAVSDDDGLVIVGAYIGGVIDLGGGARPATGATDMFVAAYAPDGAYGWDYTAGGTGDVNPSDATRLTTGEVVVGGNFNGTVDLGGGPLTALGLGASFLLQIDAAGVYGTHRSWGGDGGDNVFAVAATATGDVLAVGRFTGTVNFGGGTRTAASAADIFVATFNGSLAHRRDRVFGATGRNEATDVVVGPADSTAVAGTFFEMVDLGSGLRTATGDTDAFVVRLPN